MCIICFLGSVGNMAAAWKGHVFLPSLVLLVLGKVKHYFLNQ